MSLFSETSSDFTTPPRSSASSTFGGASTPQPPSRTKRSFILDVSYLNPGPPVKWFNTRILCVVDPLEPVEAEVTRLERLIVAVLRPVDSQIKDIQNFSLRERQPKPVYPLKPGYGTLIFQATLEQLVEHLRESDMEPVGSKPVRPDLWGTGKSRLVIPRPL